MTGIEVDVQRPGATEALLTHELKARLARVADKVEAREEVIDDSEVPERYARHVAHAVRAYLSGLKKDERDQAIADLLEAIDRVTQTPVGPQKVTALIPKGKPIDVDYYRRRPETPLNDAALLTNAAHDPSLSSELRAELASADRVDLLCAFVKWYGLRLLEEELRALNDRGGRLRVITTTYMGATERRALDRLVKEFGAEVKVQYDNNRTRLHAKSWYFHRDTGWDTAYIGSSNLSRAALLDGVEWNVRLSHEQAGSLLTKFRHTFDSYWNDPSYRTYHPDSQFEELDAALRVAGGVDDHNQQLVFAGLNVRPFPHQKNVLERLCVEREIRNHHHNLVVAATGTGKTVIAAIDYRDNLCGEYGEYPTLLFVAHRIELLEQARRTYRAVLKEGSFGELLGHGQEPSKWRHVFATVQSLTTRLQGMDPRQFQVVVVDEFHHAEASSYKRLLEWCAPNELVGLTATPERADGLDVRQFFEGRTAAEIRLWDALEADLLSPFHYFAVADNTDLGNLAWNRGRYDEKALEKLYVGNEARSGLILKQLERRVLDPLGMRALGFCVTVQHAEYMAQVFNAAGIRSEAVTGQTNNRVRQNILERLRRRDINAIFTVDLYNEGVDLPSIDTVLFLRPTESATIFLQQLGRGLRKERDKAVLTVLDYVGHQHKQFRFDKKLRALTGVTRKELEHGVKQGFSYLPPGTEINLDRMSQEIILENIKRQVRPNWKQTVTELRDVTARKGDCGLVRFLEEADLELSDVLRKIKGQNWTALREAAGLPVEKKGPRHEQIISRARAFAHVDDTERFETYRRVLQRALPPWRTLADAERIRVLMLIFSIWPGGGGFSGAEDALEALREERAACAEYLAVLEVAEANIAHVVKPIQGRLGTEVIRSHAHYSREEIVIGLRYGGFKRKPTSLQQGVFYVETLNSDVFLVTLKKNEKHYSPTTMYNDVAISPELFHWESQSATSVDSPVGRRYLNHLEMGTEVVLFVRETKSGEFGSASPYICLGTMDYVSHEGSNPIGIDWRLRQPMPGDVFKAAALR